MRLWNVQTQASLKEYHHHSDAVYAVVSPCRVGQICNRPVRLWRTTPGQGSWTQVRLALPATTCCVVLAVHGLVAYLAIPAALINPGASVDPDVLDVTVDGQHWSSRPDPCDPGNGETLVMGRPPAVGTVGTPAVRIGPPPYR